ncbi:MAG: cytochrome c3 family protein [Candidatus Aminicenantes bacterium]|nr:cytochrome c3 family protein [Candidatus Aminicenantes bacterium]
MKSLRILLPVFFVGLIVAVIVYWPEISGALNPNHSCDICHSVHSAPGQALTNNAVVEDLCLSCHGAAGVSSLKAEIHTNTTGSAYPDFSMSCIDCHDPHDSMQNWLGGTNLKMIGLDQDGTDLAKISTPNSGIRDVVFESRGTDASEPSLYSFADGDEDTNGTYDGVCEVCHTQVDHHRNSTSGGDHTHYVGQTCIDCHPHNSNFHPSGGGSCKGCHDTAQGVRRAITSDFSLTSHHVAAGTVTDDDCGVCHYESVDGTNYHNNGVVDLRDPDDGTSSTLITFTDFSRNTSSDTLESWVTDVQDNFCMKCHDSDGATATNFSGDPLQPFSSGSVNVPNVYDRFNISNSYHHTIRGAGNNPYCVPSATNGSKVTMESPWNQDATHDQISCFDCHGANGHGNSNQRMLRYSIDLDAMEAGSYSQALGISIDSFCTICHKASVYVAAANPETAGSMFEFHPGGLSQHAASGSGGNELGCLGCHAGIVNEGGIADNGAGRGNIHGGNFTWPADSNSSGVISIRFMLGGWLNGWNYNASTGYCWGGTCGHGKNAKTYTR